MSHQLGQSHELRQLLEEDLDKDPAAAGGVVLVQLDHAKQE